MVLSKQPKIFSRVVLPEPLLPIMVTNLAGINIEADALERPKRFSLPMIKLAFELFYFQDFFDHLDLPPPCGLFGRNGLPPGEVPAAPLADAPPLIPVATHIICT